MQIRRPRMRHPAHRSSLSVGSIHHLGLLQPHLTQKQPHCGLKRRQSISICSVDAIASFHDYTESKVAFKVRDESDDAVNWAAELKLLVERLRSENCKPSRPEEEDASDTCAASADQPVPLADCSNHGHGPVPLRVVNENGKPGRPKRSRHRRTSSILFVQEKENLKFNPETPEQDMDEVCETPQSPSRHGFPKDSFEASRFDAASMRASALQLPTITE